ncbi:MAG: GIY-YIG nuclease family protein [Patescibacteria group bacterium]
MSCYLYIVRCIDNSLYTGVTWNIAQRINQHNGGFRGAKSLRGKVPVKLAYSEVYNTKGEALKREKEIKGWRKDKKENLIALALRNVVTMRV